MRFDLPWLCVVCALLLRAGGALAQEAPLTECAAVRSLPREVAAEGRPVQLRGVVTFTYRKKDGGMVLQNGGVGIYVDTQFARAHGMIAADAAWPAWMERGTEIELIGVT